MTFWLKGWGWLFENPRYLILVLAPLVLGFVMAGLSIYFLFPYAPGFSEGIAAFMTSYFSEYYMSTFIGMAVYWLFFTLLVVFLAMGGALIFYCVYIILCAPFYSLLVEAVLRSQGKLLSQGSGVGHWLTMSFKLFLISLMKSFLFGIIGLGAFLLSFIPGLNLIVVIVAAMIFAFDSMDYSFEIRGMSLGERFKYFRQNRDQFVKMSLSMALTLLVPGLTFFALPGAVVGAALTIRTEK